MKRVVVWLAVVAAGFMPISCATEGGSAYTSGALYPSMYKTVAVPIFVNESQDRGMSFQLTEATIKEIESATPYKVAPESRADTVLRATVKQVSLSMLSQSLTTGLTEEMAIKVTLDFEWLDMRTGKPIVARKGFQGSSVFVASLPNNQPIDLGRFAVSQQLARDIVANLQADW